MFAEHGQGDGSVFEGFEDRGRETLGFAAEDEVAILAVAGVVEASFLFEA